MKPAFAAALVSGLFILGCGGEPTMGDSVDEGGEAVATTQQALTGEYAFKHQTFGGNGRTCSTCHSDATGTLSPADAQARWNTSASDPLLRSIDSDDGAGSSFSRLLGWATIRVWIALPAGVTLAGDPSARQVLFERGVPTTWNTPALDPWLMSDGRAPDLEAQALGAINAHMQPGWQPSAGQLAEIASFEQTLFSRSRLKAYADGSAAPALPEGTTESERRGKKFFEPVPFNPPSLAGFCAHCHSGPMLDEANQYNQGGLPVGARFASILVSEWNVRDLPVYTFVFPGTNGATTVTSPDPGRALITGNPADANTFKIPTLWGVKTSAPYFHDNSARTLADVAAHYDRFVQKVTGGALSLSAQDQADIVAYMRRL